MTVGMEGLVVRPAIATDYPGILALHQQNLRAHLTPEQQRDGFLSLAIDQDYLMAANADLGVVVAIAEATVVGYMAGTTVAFNQRFPLLAAMIARFPTTEFRQRSLVTYRSFIYGPVCVAAACRRQGVLEAMFGELLALAIAADYEVGTAFVAHQNPRSLAAHTRKLGMEHLGDFGFKGKTYALLGFGVGS